MKLKPLFLMLAVLSSTPQASASGFVACHSLFQSSMTLDDNNLNYYNQNAREYDQTRSHVSPELENQRMVFRRFLPSGGRILEIGGGHGRDALHFKSLGYKVLMTEPAVGLAKIAEQKLGESVLILKAQEISFNQEFDGVWAVASLIHVPPEDLLSVFQKLKAAVKIGGVIHASFLKGVGQPNTPEAIADGRYFNRASEERLRQTVAAVGGLRVVEDLSREQENDYFGALAPSPTFGFFNLFLVREAK